MKFIRGIYNLKSCHQGCGLTVGNFDGFHLGHQKLILKLQQEVFDRGMPSMVMIFEPQPHEYFFGVSVRLTCLRDKIKYLSRLGIDILLCVSFNKNFASVTHYSFVADLLVKKLNIKLIYVGDNFRFGANRKGNFSFLKKMSCNFGFETMKIGTYTDDCGERISSSAVRTALAGGQLARAEMLLGHTYSISGRVVCGTQLGSIIGFPTLNIFFNKHCRLPMDGVYAVEVRGVLENQLLLGVANIGICPTIHKFRESRLEVYLLDYTMDLYGRYVEVIICAKIRNEKIFSSIIDLRDQIKCDIRYARKYFNNR